MIGLALVTTVFIVGTSMKKTFAAAIEGSVGADYVLSTAGFTGFSPALTADLAEIPEVSAVTGVRFNTFLIEGSSRDVVAADAAVTDQLVDIDVQTGSLADLDDDAIFLHEDPAEDLGVTVGDHVTVEMAVGGPRELTVAGTYADAAFAGNYLIDLELFTEGYPTSNLDFFAFARLAEGADPAVARAAIDEAMTSYPQVTLEDRSEWQASQEAQFDSLLIAVNGLLGLALFIALLGIANTLALSVLERTREIGLLRAVGMLRRQVREMVLAESAMVAIFGAVLGVAIGTAFGLAIAVAMPPSVVTTTAIPFGTIAVIVAIAALCGLVAGLLPARRAARLDILRAVASELITRRWVIPPHGRRGYRPLVGGDPNTRRSPGRIARSILAVLFGVIGVIGVLASVVGVWAHRTVFNSETVAEAVDQALLNPEVNEALATFLTDQLVDAVPLEDLIADRVPDELEPFTPVLVGGVRSVVHEGMTRVLEDGRAREALVAVGRARPRSGDAGARGRWAPRWHHGGGPRTSR